MKKIKLRFVSDQRHQLIPVESTVKLFEGYRPESNSDLVLGDDTVPNMESELEGSFYKDILFPNLQAIQTENNITEKTVLEVQRTELQGVEGVDSNLHTYPEFTIEMETGTGKTYVYLKTIYELKKHYNFRKFIIVVPSIAIFEGVVKSFEITRTHFQSEYGNEPIRLKRYEGEKPGVLRDFSNSQFTEILVMTLDSFNKKTNNIFKGTDKLQGERKPYQYIQSTLPIVILDEPQNMSTELAKRAIATLNPLFILRYSATHKKDDRPNLLYRLSPVEAFRQGLVKTISVKGVKEKINYNQEFLRLDSVERKNGIRAIVTTFVYKAGKTEEDTISLKEGDELSKKTKRDDHKGYKVTEIHLGEEWIQFENGIRLTKGEVIGPQKPEIFRIQIRETLKSHFRKQKELIKDGIKVLSLFFIDRVSNYTEDEGIIRKLFDEEFNRLKKKYDLFKNKTSEEVKSAYFAKKKTKDGKEQALDTSSKNNEERAAEKEAFALIMKDKEKLLSLDEPVCFIFAHSALKEGWDNPNVFQICTLNQTKSEMKKRQEIGRGLRLAVNQAGERIMSEGVNILTVIANESYEEYVENLQKNYKEDGEEGIPGKPVNARKPEIKRNEAVFQSKAFDLFWKKLCKKATFEISIDQGKLIDSVLKDLKNIDIPEPLISLSEGTVVLSEFNLRIVEVLKDSVRIKFDHKDTAKNSKVAIQDCKMNSDLAKVFKEERLENYKIKDMKFGNDDCEVTFANQETLSKYKPIVFNTEKGFNSKEKIARKARHNYPVFNFVQKAAKETKLTRETIVEILKALPEKKLKEIPRNPESFFSTFLNILKSKLADHIAVSINYTPDILVHSFEKEEMFPEYVSYIEAEAFEADNKSLYNFVQVDSKVEENFVGSRLMKDKDVILYFKFPRKYELSLPKIIGNYNPDWGIIRYDKDQKINLELVRETKGNVDPSKLRFKNEGRKIACASKYFSAIGLSYRTITDKVEHWWMMHEEFNALGNRTDEVSP